MSNTRKIVSALIAAAISLNSFHQTNACITVSTDTSVFTVNATDVWSVYTGAVDYALENSGTDGILAYPSTRQVREWTAVMAAPYTIMALSDETALEFFGREETSSFFRICTAKDAAEEELIRLSTLESFTYTYLWSLRHYVPAWTDAVNEYAILLGVDLSSCPDTESFGCGTNTPVGFARLMYEQTRDVFDQDGWNANGELTAANNVLEYEDWREENYNENNQYLSDCTEKWRPLYEANCVVETETIVDTVMDSLSEFTNADTSSAPDMCWKPIQLQINLGTYRQQWLYPHIGEVGRSYFVGNEKICELEMEYPCYDFSDERQQVLKALGELDDEKKAKIEFYQNVWQWFMIFQRGLWDNDSDTTPFNKIRGVISTMSSLYEATLFVAKEKLRVGMHRPRTNINRDLADQSIFSYLGPSETTSGSLQGSDWVPYLFEEANSEFPSHTACQCYAFARSMRLFTGAVGLNPPISYVVDIGSSLVEDGHPLANYTFEWSDWDEMQDECAESRLNSGSHFSKSVTQTAETCSDVADIVVQAFDDLDKGVTPRNVIDTEAKGSDSTSRGCK